MYTRAYPPRRERIVLPPSYSGSLRPEEEPLPEKTEGQGFNELAENDESYASRPFSALTQIETPGSADSGVPAPLLLPSGEEKREKTDALLLSLLLILLGMGEEEGDLLFLLGLLLLIG